MIRQAAGADTLLYDPAADAVHVLNPTALAVWELCDGRHSPADVEAALRARFGSTEEHDIAGDVRAVLTRLAADGLLQMDEE